ncbi:MAG: FAD:protein FMN transferase [Actinomycetes bacterium]
MSHAVRHVHVEHVWGTVVSIDIRLHRTNSEAPVSATKEVVEWLHDVDQVFSTFKSDSVISQLRDGRISRDEVDAGVTDVIRRCEKIKSQTDGTFDPWAIASGFDPSGLVKGWAVDRTVTILEGLGFNDFMINAGGDIAVRGESAPGEQWVIGITHPEIPGEIYTSVPLTNQAIATSALYERGDHVTNPSGGKIAASSATVVGPECATADALATALLIGGVPGLQWLEAFPEYSGQVVTGKVVTSQGLAFS